MKKVLYLHGLESKQGGLKVDFLANEFCVHAPAMDFKNPILQNELEFIMCQFDPDLIIGSSMGGYVADILARSYGKPAILFNPALHNRSFDPKISNYTPDEDDILQEHKIVILVKNDDVKDGKEGEEGGVKESLSELNIKQNLAKERERL